MVQLEFEVGSEVLFDPSIEHLQYTMMKPAWAKCRDAVDGGVRIKDKAKTYLPVLNSRQTEEDYADYLNRAYWYGATGKTAGTFLAMMFRRPPVITFETDVDPTEDNLESELQKGKEEELLNFFSKVTSDNRAYEAVIREAVQEVLVVNRVGILEDYPPQAVDEDGQPILITELEKERQGLRSYTALYKAEDIINWKLEEVDNEKKPTFFVLHEEQDEELPADPLNPGVVGIYRILYLYEEDNGDVVYKVAVLTQKVPMTKKGIPNTRRKTTYTVTEAYTPLVDGEPMSTIPFWIVAGDGIRYDYVETPLIYDLVEINLAHYRNSADYERELHYIAIRTAIFPGWNKNEWGEPEIGGALAAPPDQTPFILEAKSTSPMDSEMRKKEERMAVLGAQLLAQKTKYVEAAETAAIHSRGEASVIASIARAVGMAFSLVFKTKLVWSGFDGIDPVVALNDDFDEKRYTAEDLKPLMELLQAGAISFHVYFYALQQIELYPPKWTEDQEKVAIVEDQDELFGGLSGGVAEELQSAIAEIQQKIAAREAGVELETEPPVEPDPNEL